MAYSQKNQICRVTSPFGDDALLLERMHASEAVSSLFCYQLELFSENDELAFEPIVGKPLTVSVHLDNGKQRHFHGLVSRFAQGKSRGPFSTYRAEIVPALWLLTRRSSCRIFQHLSVPDIAKKLFGELGVTEVKLELQKSYPEREYTVQFRESDFNFMSRLFEDVGISYYFTHDAKSHTLVLFDSPGGNPPCPGQSTAVYVAAAAEGVGADVTDFSVERELRAGKYSHTDYNFEQPSLSLHTTTPTSHAIGGNDRLEIYEHSGDFMEPGHGETRVKLRMEAEESASLQARGVSRCLPFAPGYRFDLRGHHRKNANEAWVITEVSHSIVDSIAPDEVASYENTFVCRPHKIPLRPLRNTPKPLISGVQTATVVGAAGKEIDVDSHARVVVQFHWDREGKKNDKSSCRIRVAQNSAGKGWGLIAHPRIGQEVVVEFIDGDPDRPLVIGMVYNGEQTPPYASDTQMGLKSRSTPGGGGFNELRFDDKKGSEELFINSQKNTNIVTGNNKDEKVKVDSSVTVGSNHTASIGANESHSVGGNRTKNITGSETTTVGSTRTETVTGAETVTINSTRTHTVTGAETVTLGGGRTHTVTGSESLNISSTRTHTIAINDMLNVGAAQEVTVAGGQMLNVGAAQMQNVGGLHSLNVGGIQAVKVGGSASLTAASRTVKAGGAYSVSAGADASIGAPKIAITGDSEISIKAGGASITLKGGDIVIKAGKIKIEGSGKVIVKGSEISEN